MLMCAKLCRVNHLVNDSDLPCILHLDFVCLFKGESHYNIAQAGLTLKNVLPQTPKACTTIRGYHGSLIFITYILIYVYDCVPA